MHALCRVWKPYCGYLGRILMLTLLAPNVVEAIMDGRQPAELAVHVLREGFPVEWGEQRVRFINCQRLHRENLLVASVAQTLFPYTTLFRS